MDPDDRELPEPWRRLPAPVDDGAADHLPGRALPAVPLAATDGSAVRLSDPAPGRTVVFVYPLTASPDAGPPEGWDDIPGARGCTPQACGFRDRYADLREAGAAAVYGLSAQSTAYQREVVDRLHLPYAMLADPRLALRDAMGLPTFAAAGMTLYRRLTMVITGGVVEHVFYPVFPPHTHAERVVEWLRG